MISRYARPEMSAIWSQASKYRIWFEIEAHGCDALADLGVIPKQAAETIWEKGGAAEFDVARIDAIEREVKHDVIAFLTHLAEFIGEEARFVHQGFTSSDILDTTLSVQLARATDLLLVGMDRVLAALKSRALEHRHTITIGRSHGIHAEPTTFGIKLARFYAEFSRGRDRLLQARDEIAVCAISGAIGTFANIDPAVEAHVAEKMGLSVEPVSSQIIPRDRHAAYFAALGVIASSIENIAVEIRHLQRTEVLEAEEFFSKGQKGSSAMPHKRNPVLTENLTGLARLVRMAVMPAMENVALWHERDISHSSVERGIAPDTTIHLDFALHRLAGVIENLVVYPDKMKANMDRLGGLHNSQRVLLALTQAGEQRESAYRLVQRNAMKVWDMFRDEGGAGDGAFQQLLHQDPEVSALLTADQIDSMFDDAYHLKHVDTIFDRVFD
ncbi:adenylosuccinate lyase [Algimonas porphyrae]|uniref:Adenylosuccinate lyase n=1 Tax=Algimonas porphyrae TaxID=1128113 RepID=A0ABQ5UW14_9PROT|nr:adenylosuccinate lyase [Algimonas porphyrae]GLQ19287.1 adenylosuccinate lyase [Algimonas porphyrae]